ncbi:MAG: class I SAM-dependent methyltransferase [Deltaproteobacteria bacterium]|nr:class I SAM-dependent methyltransferase [Deltaproteobacteria bacterium]
MLDDSQKDRCRICNSDDLVTILSDLTTRLGEVYSLSQCRACSFISTSPLPSFENLRQYYDQDYWLGGNGKTSKLLTRYYAIRMAGTIKNLKQRVLPEARILDWGAGDGSFLRLLDRQGYDSYGIDNFSSPISHKKLISASIEDAPFVNEFFDAITCFHVLEHISNPVPSVAKAFSLLKPGGIFVVEVPNIASWGFKVFKKAWYPLDIPVHLNHFNPAVLQMLFEHAGQAELIKTNYFSNRHSPSFLLLSLIPAISPPRVRSRYSGYFPLPLMILYLFLQLIIYPFSKIEALMGRGEVIRMYVRKKA